MAVQVENELSIGLATPPPEVLLTPNIGVIGIGGAGGNAINNMIQSGLTGVSFFAANTDAQALTRSLVADKIQLGAAITKGLGAGANPEIGKAAAEESEEKIKEALTGLHLLFLAAGMGGGTGTGAAPVVAKIAKEMNILTVGVVSKPFNFEGSRRMKVAEQGIIELQKYVDTLVVVPNQNLYRIAGDKMSFTEGFKIADNVLCQGVRSITDLIMKPGLINLDFADVKTVLSTMGRAMMGTGEATGENRAIESAEKAITNPLLDNTTIKGAKSLLLNISSGDDLTVSEFDTAAERVRAEVDPNATIIVGFFKDEELAGKMRVSIVATGIDDLVSGEAQTVAEQQVKPAEKPIEITPSTPIIPTVPVEKPLPEKEPELIAEVETVKEQPTIAPIGTGRPDLVIHLDEPVVKQEPNLIDEPTPPSMPEAISVDDIPEEKEDIVVEPQHTTTNVKPSSVSFIEKIWPYRPKKQPPKKEVNRERTLWDELDDLEAGLDLPRCLVEPRK